MKISSRMLAAAAILALAAGCAEQNRGVYNSPQSQPYPPSTETTGNTNGNTGPVYTNSGRPGEIPAGTQISIRTNEQIDVQSTANGRTYSAQTTSDIIGPNNQVLVPRYSPVQLMVINTGDSKNQELELGIQSITINGQSYRVETGTMTKSGGEGIGVNKRTGEYVGGGALLGTLLGAMMGGGKGAAIGAAVGAAGGAAAQVLTKGKEVKIPAETVLNFQLNQPIELQGYGG
jgi:hypothetical protein